MQNKKINVFLTGATGVMGMAGLKELTKYPGRYSITVLARNTKINHKKLSLFQEKGVKVIWGDLLDYDVLKEGIFNADIVLHVGGMVSPKADLHPAKTLQINIESVRLITSIVKEIERKDVNRQIKVVYIGSVSQYGSLLPPNHWGGVGNKMQCAIGDAYALSKILAERILIESNIKKWVSLRQTGILHPGLLKKVNDPIMFHVPLRGVLEWISVNDSGRVLERICRENIPENFWNQFYNIGGGKNYRLTNYEFEQKLLKAIGAPAPEKIFNPEWFATQNFHGIWFTDSEKLDEILHYQDKKSFDDYLKELKKELTWYYNLTPLAPSWLIKLFMKHVAESSPLGTLSWIKNNELEKINIFWNGLDNYKKIKDWPSETIPERIPSGNLSSLEKNDKMPSEYSKNDYILEEKKCEKNHSYLSSKILEIGGHGCPYCLIEESKVNYKINRKPELKLK